MAYILNVLMFISVCIWIFQPNLAQDHWFALENKAYYVFNGAGINFINADAACISRNAQMPLITSTAQNEFIRNKLENSINRRYWLNLQPPNPSCTCVGRTYDECTQCRQSWQWWDGTPMLYQNLKSTPAPRPQGGGRQCAAVYGGPFGEWDDTSCSNSNTGTDIFLYVCQYNCISGNCEDHTCTLSGQTYICQCSSGKTGVHCDTDFSTINECLSSPCVNGACTDLYNSYRCECPGGYTGQNCEIDINECGSSPCRNGGLCRNEIASYTCNCVSGYSGSNCEIDFYECSSNPCQNDGRCNNLVGRYTCNCTSAFAGIRCTEDVNECNANPCRNSGTCTSMIGSFSCNCPRGYTGFVCESDADEYINECTMQPCTNDGICVNSFGSYSCNCAKEFMGMHCEEDFNECDLEPCQNNGTCQNSYGSYNCACAIMYEGPNCERILATKLQRNTEGPATQSDLIVGLLAGLILMTISTISLATMTFILYKKLRATKACKYVDNSAQLDDMHTTEPDNVLSQKTKDAAYEVVEGRSEISNPNYETANATSTEYENNYQILKI